MTLEKKINDEITTTFTDFIIHNKYQFIYNFEIVVSRNPAFKKFLKVVKKSPNKSVIIDLKKITRNQAIDIHSE